MKRLVTSIFNDLDSSRSLHASMKNESSQVLRESVLSKKHHIAQARKAAERRAEPYIHRLERSGIKQDARGFSGYQRSGSAPILLDGMVDNIAERGGNAAYTREWNRLCDGLTVQSGKAFAYGVADVNERCFGNNSLSHHAAMLRAATNPGMRS